MSLSESDMRKLAGMLCDAMTPLEEILLGQSEEIDRNQIIKCHQALLEIHKQLTVWAPRNEECV